MDEFDDGEDFEITFFSRMEGGGIDDRIGIFDVVDFLRGEGRVNNILSEVKESRIIIFLDGDIGMDGETGVVPRAQFINESIGDAVMIFEHGEDFFAEDDESMRGIDMRNGMEVAEGIKNAISNKAMDVGIPGEEVAKGLDGGDEAGLKRFMRENGTKEFNDSFGSTSGKLSQEGSIAIKESAKYFGDSKYPLTVRDILQEIIFNP